MSSLRALQEFLMKPEKFPEILKRIRAFVRPGRTHLPCYGDVPSAAESTSYSSSPIVPASAGPPSPPRQSEEEEVRVKAEELSTRRLDVSWDVGVLYISTEGKESSHKLLGNLRGQADETRLLGGVLKDQFYPGESAVEVDIQVFAAQTNDQPGHSGTTGAPQSADPYSPQNNDAPIQPDSSPSSGVVRSDREQEPSNRQSHTDTPPITFPQLRQVLPAEEQLSGDPNWSSPPTHEFDGITVPHLNQGPSGGPGGLTMVMRLNPGVSRPGLQTDSNDTDPNVSEGIKYGGGKHRFVCETCGQPFSSRYNVKRHQQSTNVHKGDRPGREEGIFCGRCGQKLSRPDALKRHERNGACGKRPGGSGQGGQGSSTAFPL